MLNNLIVLCCKKKKLTSFSPRDVMAILSLGVSFCVLGCDPSDCVLRFFAFCLLDSNDQNWIETIFKNGFIKTFDFVVFFVFAFPIASSLSE